MTHLVFLALWLSLHPSTGYSVSPRLTEPSAHHEKLIAIYGNTWERELVSISYDGAVDLAPGVPVDEAAKAFWKAVGHWTPRCTCK